MTSRLSQARLLIELRQALRRAERFDAADPAERTARRAESVAALRGHALRHSRFYQQLHAGHEDAPLDQLPVLSKAQMVEHFDDIVTDPSVRRAGVQAFVESGSVGERYLGRYRVAISSGSSGRPGLFVFDRHEWVGHLAAAARSRSLARQPGPPLGGVVVRSAKIGSTSPWHLSAQVGATLEDPRKPSLRLGADTPLPALVEALDEWRPDILSSYPGVLQLLAQEQLDGRLHIQPRQVFPSGAVLTAGTRERIRRAWGELPFDQYVATEVGHLAAECSEHRGMHLLDDRVIVEVVDAAGTAVPAGETGARVLVTVLDSRTVPLIRCELDDGVRIDPEPCPCGRRSPVVAEVVGRSLDWLHLPSGHRTVAVPPNLFTGVMDAERVTSWQIVEQGGRVTALVTGPESGFTPSLTAERIGAALIRLLGEAPPVEVRVVDRIDVDAGGKQPLVKSASSRSEASDAPPDPTLM